MTVGIDWKTGIAAKDWDAVAKKENLVVSFILNIKYIYIHVPAFDSCVYVYGYYFWL